MGGTRRGRRKKSAGKRVTTPTPAQQSLIEDHLKIVHAVANSLVRRLPHYVDRDDLVAAGYIGLVEAVTRYDVRKTPTKDMRSFNGYVAWRIRGAMIDHIRSTDHLSRDFRRYWKLFQKTSHTLLGELGRPPHHEELRARLGFESDHFYDLLAHLQTQPVTIEERPAQKHDSTRYDQPSVYSARDHSDESIVRRLDLDRCLGVLTERQRQVVELYYLADISLKEIGESFGLTESRICQIMRDATAALRAEMLCSEISEIDRVVGATKGQALRGPGSTVLQ